MTEDFNPEDPTLVAFHDEDEEDNSSLSVGWRERQLKKRQMKNQPVIDKFLGKGPRTYATAILPRYYGELLAWALYQKLKRTPWKIVDTLGYREPEPIYSEVNTGSEKLKLLKGGQILVENDNDRISITVDINPGYRTSVQMEGPVENKQGIDQFVEDVITIAKDENFYRGKKIEFAGLIHFLNIKDKPWDSIVLDDETKAEIKSNTVSFLKQSEQWIQYGIPAKRGVLLSGEPGTGKTIICKALMSEADGITCITTNAYALDADGYVTELYELADDLSPSIVFIEDLDLIGQSRMEFGYQRGSALLALLAVLDGVEEQKKIVTVATTNFLESLDKALSQRPSRFDRVIRLTRPSMQQRRQIVNRLCRKIPIDEIMQEYISIKADNCTPAQLQEIIYSLVIQHTAGQSELSFNKTDVERAISHINDKNRYQIGFVVNDNHNGHKLPQITENKFQLPTDGIDNEKFTLGL
jgi:cell division protease FtsH